MEPGTMRKYLTADTATGSARHIIDFDTDKWKTLCGYPVEVIYEVEPNQQAVCNHCRIEWEKRLKDE